VSVGHTARILEEAGIATVSIYIRAFAHHAHRIKPPRVLLTRHILGRTIGAPGDIARQTEVVAAALDLLATATAPNTIRELPAGYRPGSTS
jgi:hypothetical protein